MACKSPQAIAKRMEYQRQYRRRNNEREAPLLRAWTDRNLVHRYEYSRKRRLRLRYNLTEEQFQKLLKAQDYKCAICMSHLERASWGVRGGNCHGICAVVDHKDKEVRGILCSRCNLGIGMLLDDPDILRSAIEYLLDNGAKVRSIIGREK